eukprot:172564-Rhodomonas_salina.1
MGFVLKAVLNHAGVNDTRHIPSRSILSRMMIEMLNLSRFHAGQTLAKAKHRSITHDGTTGLQGKMITACISTEAEKEGDNARVMSIGSVLQSDGTAKQGCGGMLELIRDVQWVLNVAGYPGMAKQVTIACFNAGTQSDSAKGEDAINDLLEIEIVKWHVENTPGWSTMSREVQRGFVQLIRCYCYQHKVDNLSKGVETAFEKLSALFLPTLKDKYKSSGHKTPSASNYMHAAQKLIGMKGGKSNGNTLNIHKEFKDHLERKGMVKELEMLGGIGALVGDRFWARNKNAAVHYGLLGALTDFLNTEYKQLRRSKQDYTENQLVTSVRTLSTFSLGLAECTEEQIQQVMVHILAHLRAQAAIHYAVMVPALKACATGIKHAGQQGPEIRKTHKFLKRCVEEKGYARLLITKHDAPVSYVNPDGLYHEDAFCSPAQREAYNRMCEPCEHDDITVEVLETVAAAMLKVNINMSWDLLRDEEGALDHLEHSEGKSADNITDERYFAKMDWRTRISRMLSQIRKDALCVWETNKTSEWIDSLPREIGDELICIFAQHSVTEATIQLDKKRYVTAEKKRKQKDAEDIESQAKKTNAENAKLTLPDGFERWTVDDCEERLQALQAIRLKLLADQ